MSRLCVKNLPKGANESKLQALFATKGEITDVRIVRNQSGKSRMFGFVGFRTEMQADEAMKFFHNTFFETSRICVEQAVRYGDQSVQTAARSVHTKKKIARDLKKSAGENENAKAKTAEAEEKKKTTKKPDPVDREKLEFFETMKPRSQAQFWSNDEYSTKLPLVSPGDIEGHDSDDESVNEVQASVADALVSTMPKGNTASLSIPSSSSNRALSDMDFLRSKVAHISDSSDSDSESESESADATSQFAQGSSTKKKPRLGTTPKQKGSLGPLTGSRAGGSDTVAITDTEDSHGEGSDAVGEKEMCRDGGHDGDDAKGGSDDVEGGRLFVRNLPFTCTEDDLTALFQDFGPVTEVHIPLDTEKKGKGFGFVQFMIPEHADAALGAKDGSSFQGRLLHIIKAKEKRQQQPAEEADGRGLGGRGSVFQQQREQQRRLLAGKKESWNSSFLHGDAVVSSLAEKYGVSRSDVLDPSLSGGDLAVRLAIGETDVQQDNRAFLSQHGVSLAALESATSAQRASARSTTTLLVKNLPPASVEAELEAMFTRFGSVASFIFPPSRTIALVDFVEPSEARAAFKGLAYRKYKHLPLYLEWAPLGVLDKSKRPSVPGGSNAGAATSKAGAESSGAAGGNSAALAGGDGASDEYSALYLKNLNFETTEDGLQRHLRKHGCADVRAVSLPTKLVGSHSLPMGFGFVEFRSAAAAAAALPRLHGSLLDGHALEAKASTKRLSGTAGASSGGSGTVAAKRALSEAFANGVKPSAKLIVRNVAFQATPAELRNLFAAFGSIKRVRIPKKMGGVHRGFAFVEFSSAQEAANAMASLTGVHLYGRHLVLEWAKEDEQEASMTALRKKAKKAEGAVTAQHDRDMRDKKFGGPGAPGGKAGAPDTFNDETVDLSDDDEED